MSASTLSKRHKLPHEVPPWIEQGARHFITINCRARGGDPLIQGEIADHLMESARFYESIGRWYIWLMVVMPDHVHLIATFDLQRGIKNTVSDWKRHQTTQLKIDWQSDFFEHRLRDEAELEEKAHYIRMNPVRKGLVSNSEEWPFIIDRTDLNIRGSPGPTPP